MRTTMAIWKNDKEKHTPFAPRGNGRMREMEERMEHLEEQALGQLRLLIVDEPPEKCQPNTLYLVCKDIDE